jgi:hypothetical protein
MQERFWSKVKKTSGCWLWIGARHTSGYGLFWLEGRWQRAHRVSYELAVGTIPLGLWVLHRCDVRPCVRPKHFFLGTVSENSADMVAKGRAARGERHGCAKLNPDQVREIRELAQLGRPQRTIAVDFEVSQSAVSQIVRGFRWAHV